MEEDQKLKGNKYLKVLVYGGLAMYLVLSSAWPWLWPDAYYHGTLTYIYVLSLINVTLVVNTDKLQDRWLLKGVCMGAGITFIEIIDEINKLVPIIDSDPEKFRWWEYYAAVLVILVCLIGVRWFKMLSVCIKEQAKKTTVYTKRNIQAIWKKINTAWKVWNLRKERGS
jgi:uncharacterized membrane protein